MKSYKAKIIGTGSAFPGEPLDNQTVHDELKRVHNDDVWPLGACQKIFGVKTRHWSRDIQSGKLRDESCSDVGLSVQAANNALDMAGLAGEDIDLIIHATGTADYWVDPDPAILIHDRIGARDDCGAMSLAITCVGLTHGMAIGSHFIQSGTVKNVLVTASNVYSMIRKKAWQMMFFCGDAGASVILTRTSHEDKSGMEAFYLGARNGKRGVYARYNTIMEEVHTDAAGEFFPDNVAVEGAKSFRSGIKKILDNHPGLAPDWVITHQANYTLQKFASKKFKVSLGQIPYNLDRRGNTLDASCGTVLDEQIRKGEFQKGDLIASVAVGTGWHYNATLFRL